jgi:putative DNA primase/helicase
MTTKEAAHRRWRAILPALGVPLGLLDKKAQPCPFCGGTDRFVFDDKHGNGDYFCRQCGPGNGFVLLEKLNGWDFKRTADEVDRIIGAIGPPKTTYVKRGVIRREDVSQLWTDARQIKRRDPVDAYLRSRSISPDDLQIAVPFWAKGLRFTSRMWHAPTRKFLPCMFAMFRTADGDLGTIHRTYLTDVEPRRMFLPHAVPKGGAIRLGEPRAAMGVAEGVETALAAALISKMSVWAVTSERLLRDWIPPPDVKHITVFGDNDANYVGQAAAYALANRLVLKGHEVVVAIPSEPGWDWNDVLRIEGGPDLSQLRLFDKPDGSTVQPVPDA